MPGKKLLAVMAALMLILAACDDDDASSTDTSVSEDVDTGAEQLYGTWDIVDVGSYHTYESDGTWHVATVVGGDPDNTGTYTFDGSIVTFDTDEDWPECPETTGSVEVTFGDPDTMSLELIDDECEVRGYNVPRSPWVRVEED